MNEKLIIEILQSTPQTSSEKTWWKFQIIWRKIEWEKRISVSALFTEKFKILFIFPLI